MLLVRFGVIPEVSRCVADEAMTPTRGQWVIVDTHRGLMMGTVLDIEPRTSPNGADAQKPETSRVLRIASDADVAASNELRTGLNEAFALWQQRIADWQLDLQLIDLEWTLDRAKLILYVLSDRGPDCTKLALRAAAAGLGAIEVQPVSSDGLVTLAGSQGGCGSCGCG